MEARLPKFAVDLDQNFAQFGTVYVIGDVHDNQETFIAFLMSTGIGFLLPNQDNQTGKINDISKYRLKPGVLLVFLGDVVYKTKQYFKSIAKFILNNKESCVLILGNNEVKFIYEHIDLFLNFANGNIPRYSYLKLTKAVKERKNRAIVAIIYSIIHWFRKADKNNRMKQSWKWYYECLFNEYQSDKINLEDIMFLMYIMTESIVIGYSKTLKLVLLHAGLNPQRTLESQRIMDICNIRTVNQAPWYVNYSDMDCTFLFGHWSKLTKDGITSKPHIYLNSICLDTGCCYTNVLSYIVFNPQNINKRMMHSYSKFITFSNSSTFYELSFVYSDNM